MFQTGQKVVQKWVQKWAQNLAQKWVIFWPQKTGFCDFHSASTCQNRELRNLWHQKLTILATFCPVFIKFSTYREKISVKSWRIRDKVNSPIYTKKYCSGLKKSRGDSQSVFKNPKKSEKKLNTFIHLTMTKNALTFYTKICIPSKWPKNGQKRVPKWPIFGPPKLTKWGVPKLGGSKIWPKVGKMTYFGSLFGPIFGSSFHVLSKYARNCRTK